MVSRYNLIDQREIQEKSAIFYGEEPTRPVERIRRLRAKRARKRVGFSRKIDGKRRRKVSLSALPSLPPSLASPSRKWLRDPFLSFPGAIVSRARESVI